MTVYTLLIINKAGGLIYNRNFTNALSQLSTNDYLVLAGTFHGVHALTRSLTPAPLVAPHTTADSLLLPSTFFAPGGGPPPASIAAAGSGGSGSNSLSQSSSSSKDKSLGGGGSGSDPGPLAGADASGRVPQNRLSGLEVLESALFRLTCLQTATGTKFLLFTEPRQADAEVVVRRVYELYTDYVMKNPFYGLENPIRCDAFERHLGSYLKGK